MILSLLTLALSAQSNKGKAILLPFSFGYHLPGGDWADRFGNHNSLGTGVFYLTEPSNWILGLQGNLLFGNTVKEDVLAGLRTPEGFIYGNERSVADIRLRQRGVYIGAAIGKMFSLQTSNPRAGILLSLGMGLLQHKIRIQDDPETSVPQLLGDYKKGYDRLSNGLAFTQFIGYQHLGKEGKINFFVGIEVLEALTKNRRELNFDVGAKDEGGFTDLQFGIRAGWILPLYLGNGSDVFY